MSLLNRQKKGRAGERGSLFVCGSAGGFLLLRRPTPLDKNFVRETRRRRGRVGNGGKNETGRRRSFLPAPSLLLLIPPQLFE